MSDPTVTREIQIDSPDTGHGVLLARVITSGGHGLMPILIARGGYEIHLRWSEWAEVRDHIAGCELIASPDGATDTSEYELCNAIQGPFGAPLPCILERGHDDDATDDATQHSDRLGRRW